MYTAPVLVSLCINLFALFLLVALFREEYAGLHPSQLDAEAETPKSVQIVVTKVSIIENVM